MSGLGIVMILGSVRSGRMVERVSKLVTNAVTQNTKMSVSVIDPLSSIRTLEVNMQPMHFIQNPAEVPGWMKKMNEDIKNANGFLILTPEYNGMIPPALTNVMNSFPPASYRHRPCGIVAYAMGMTGGSRALNALRPYVCEFGMPIVPGYCLIPTVHETVDPEGNSSNTLLQTNLKNLVKNLEWYAEAIKQYNNMNALVD